MKPLRVLVVDDSSLVRSVLREGFTRAGLEVVGAARDPYEARDLLVELRPDVLTLDVEMPKMDGVTFLQKFMAVMPTPTVVLSSLTIEGSALALQALEAGAVDVVAKPSSLVADGLAAMMRGLVEKVKVAARVQVARRQAPVKVVEQTPLEHSTDLVIGLGASTGGVAALGRVLPAFPAWSPGVVVVQHMPEGFTRQFAENLAPRCAMQVSEAVDGQRVLRGHVLVAPGGNRHLVVRRVGGEYRVFLIAGPLISGHQPSVDVFFSSLAEHVGANAAACLLTGMGADGAEGLLRLRQAGGRTFAQDRETSSVWGMPGEAHARGAAEALLALEAVPHALLASLQGQRERA